MEEQSSLEQPASPDFRTGPAPTPTKIFAALRHRNFQLYFGGQLISNAGTWMQIIALGWLVYQLTHSDLALGVVGFASAIPSLLVSPWGGVVVDRVSKRNLLIITQASAMLLAFILAILAFTGAVREWHIILLAAGLGVVNSFDGPGRQAFVVEMVGREDLPNAIALNSMMFNSARVIGPAVGGLLLAIIGAAWCFTINGLSYLAVIAGLWLMRMPAAEPVYRLASPWNQLTEGVKYVSRQAELGGLLLLALFFSIFGISYSTILPAFVEQVLKQGALAYGIINAVTGLGAVVGAFAIARYAGRHGRGRWLQWASLGFPVFLFIFGFATYFPLALILVFALGVGFMVEFTMINTLLQTRVDDALRGRVMSLYTLTFFGFAPFGNLAMGALAEKFGLSNTIGAFAIATLVLVWTVLRKIPDLRKLP